MIGSSDIAAGAASQAVQCGRGLAGYLPSRKRSLLPRALRAGGAA